MVIAVILKTIEIYLAMLHLFVIFYRIGMDQQMQQLKKSKELTVSGSNHNLKKIKLAYKNMLSRCYSKLNDSYGNYGGRGIGVCDEWVKSRDLFISWALKNNHQDSLSLDRIDNEKGYSPKNCKWSTVKEQLRNQRRNVFITHNNISRTIGEWCEALSLTEKERAKVYKRYNTHNACTYNELFCSHLRSYRVSKRDNKCLVCGLDKSAKWRKDGSICNNCYHRALRWSKKTAEPIENYHEWVDIQGYAKLGEKDCGAMYER